MGYRQIEQWRHQYGNGTQYTIIHTVGAGPCACPVNGQTRGVAGGIGQPRGVAGDIGQPQGVAPTQKYFAISGHNLTF